jgi:DNA polymerase-1
LSNVYRITTSEDALDVLRWLGERRPEQILAIDVETGGLDWHRDPLRLVQISDGEDAFVISWKWFAGLVRDVVTRWDGEWVGHNLSFDLKFLEGPQGFDRIGFFPVTRSHDTMLMTSLVDPEKQKGLKPTAARHGDLLAISARDELDEGMKKNKWTWATVPEDYQPYWYYGGTDTISTANLYPKLLERITMMDCLNAYDIEREARAVCTRMEQRGSPVDLDYCRRKANELRQFAAETAAYAKSVWGISNLGSNDEVVAKLRDEGVPLTKMTASGAKLSLDEEVLESPLVQAHPLAKAVHGHRKAIKLASTYFESFIDKNVNGRLHPSINTVAARTGRMSINNPAMQTLPRGPIVRNAIIADPGNSVFAADYQGMEARDFAGLAMDERMIAVCKAFDAGTGPDIHTATAQLIYGLGDEKPTKEQRDVTKNALFAATYGAGAKKFAFTAGLDLATGKAVFDKFLDLYPGIRQLQKKLIDELTASAQQGDGETGYIRQLDGRVHPIELDKAYTAINYMIQGSCATIFKQALINCSRAGLDDYLLLPVHDEIVGQAPNDIANDIADAVARNMERLDLPCPLVVSHGPPGPSWADAK